MIEINWDPVGHLGPIPINWYGLGWAAAFLTGWCLTRRWARRYRIDQGQIDDVLVWILFGTMAGARLYFIIQNDPVAYLREPWRIVAIWEGGLAFFGGLFGGIPAGYLYSHRHGVPFAQTADLFAPAVAIGGAIGRIACGLAGMDYGTPSRLPWAVRYLHPNSYAPNDGVSRHPTQFYELAGDLVIAGASLQLRGKLPEGGLFLLYLVLFSVLRFFLFFVRGDVPIVGLGLTNAQWTALAILLVSLSALLLLILWRPQGEQLASKD